MNQSQQMINDISSLSGELTEEDCPLAVGDKVRFGGGAIHGRYVGEITRLFGNGKASVKSTVRGREKVFHPDMDDMSLFTEGMWEAFKVGDKVRIDPKLASMKSQGEHNLNNIKLIKRFASAKTVLTVKSIPPNDDIAKVEGDTGLPGGRPALKVAIIQLADLVKA